MGGGWLDGGSFHMIEFNQCLLERRAGGESGVEWVEACKGDAAIAGERGRLLTAFLAGLRLRSSRRRRCWCVVALASGSFDAGKTQDHCSHLGCILPRVPAIIVCTGGVDPALFEACLCRSQSLAQARPSYSARHPSPEEIVSCTLIRACFQGLARAPVAEGPSAIH